MQRVRQHVLNAMTHVVHHKQWMGVCLRENHVHHGDSIFSVDCHRNTHLLDHLRSHTLYLLELTIHLTLEHCNLIRYCRWEVYQNAAVQYLSFPMVRSLACDSIDMYLFMDFLST